MEKVYKLYEIAVSEYSHRVHIDTMSQMTTAKLRDLS